MTLDPAVAAVRLAVRRTLAVVATPGDPVLVACSGGADSLALLAATIFEAREEALRVIGVTVDHGLQEGSADHAMRVVAQMAQLGADETATISVTVDPGGQGIEAAAREARYAALAQIAEHFGAHVVLLGHTLDDQAETVLLGLARGSGARSLSGMRRSIDGLFHRPLLDVTRAQTEAACRAEGIEWWEDPHNSGPAVHPVSGAAHGDADAGARARPGDRGGARPHGEQLRADMDFIEPFELEAYARARTDDGIDMRRDRRRWATRSGTRCAAGPPSTQGAIASELPAPTCSPYSDRLVAEHGQVDPAPRPRHGVRRGRGAALQADRASRIVRDRTARFRAR